MLKLIFLTIILYIIIQHLLDDCEETVPPQNNKKNDKDNQVNQNNQDNKEVKNINTTLILY